MLGFIVRFVLDEVCWIYYCGLRWVEGEMRIGDVGFFICFVSGWIFVVFVFVFFWVISIIFCIYLRKS